jgi:hypothetical protein
MRRSLIFLLTISINSVIYSQNILESYFHPSFPAIRGIIQHQGNAGNGLQIISQGANNSIYGSGDISFWTPSANSLSSSIDAVLSQKMIIKFNGNVGIGTTQPNSKLVISSNGTNGISFDPDAIGFNRNVTDGYIFNTAVSAWQFTARDERFTLEGYNGAAHDLFTVLKNGNVGICTTNPQKQLDVNGTIGIFGSGLDGSNYQRTVIYSDVDNGLYFDAPIKADGTYLPINFAWRGGSPMASFKKLSNSVQFDVNGTIHAKEVKVDLNNWSDFVFSPTYKLPSLSEVEKYVKANNHLPEIPSAKEVQQNGVSVGEMQNKLLQKVEELTLYVIELKKENEQLKFEMEKLKNK